MHVLCQFSYNTNDTRFNGTSNNSQYLMQSATANKTYRIDLGIICSQTIRVEHFFVMLKINLTKKFLC